MPTIRGSLVLQLSASFHCEEPLLSLGEDGEDGEDIGCPTTVTHWSEFYLSGAVENWCQALGNLTVQQRKTVHWGMITVKQTESYEESLSKALLSLSTLALCPCRNPWVSSAHHVTCPKRGTENKTLREMLNVFFLHPFFTILHEVKAFKVMGWKKTSRRTQKKGKKRCLLRPRGPRWWFSPCSLLASFWALTMNQALDWALSSYFLFCSLQPPYMVLLSCPFHKWGNPGSVWDIQNSIPI